MTCITNLRLPQQRTPALSTYPNPSSILPALEVHPERPPSPFARPPRPLWSQENRSRRQANLGHLQKPNLATPSSTDGCATASIVLPPPRAVMLATGQPRRRAPSPPRDMDIVAGFSHTRGVGPRRETSYPSSAPAVPRTHPCNLDDTLGPRCHSSWDQTALTLGGVHGRICAATCAHTVGAAPLPVQPPATSRVLSSWLV